MQQRPGLAARPAAHGVRGVVEGIGHAVRTFGGFFNRATQAERPTAGARVVRGRTGAGVYIDEDEALKDATVWACITWRSNMVAQLPWRAMREDPQLGKVIQSSHPADYLLNKRPNEEMGAFTFRQTMMQWKLRFGNAYAEIERDNRGAAYALWPIHPRRVCPMRDAAGVLFYRVYNALGAGYVDIDAMDMFHIRGLGDGPVGMSVIAYAAESIGWAKATQVFGATYFSEGMNPSGVVETEAGLSPAALDVLREELESLYNGPRGKRTVILDKGMKFNRLSTEPNDSQFIETRYHQVEEACRWFQTPPHKAMHLLRATFSNIEHQAIEVVTDVVTPDARILEDEADYKMFGGQNRGGLYTKMFLQALLRGDNASRADFYAKMIQVGMSMNEIAALEDRNPLGPDGDVRFVPANMMTLERAIALGESAVTPEGQASRPVPPPPAATDTQD